MCCVEASAEDTDSAQNGGVVFAPPVEFQSIPQSGVVDFRRPRLSDLDSPGGREVPAETTGSDPLDFAPAEALDFVSATPFFASVEPSQFGVFSLLSEGRNLARARAHLREVVARAEAGPEGYDAVQHQARIRPPAPPSSMALAEIFSWIEATPGQHHAIGRYQVIPSTLAELVTALSIGPDDIYSPALQDRLADHLMDAAGLPALCRGAISPAEFQNKLARIWAGLPTTQGGSHYDGYAGNKATLGMDLMSAEIRTAMQMCAA